MGEFPGFPSNDFDFHFEEVGGALAGLLMRTRDGHVIAGVLPNRESILSAGSGWTIQVEPFVAARDKARAVLLGGATEEVLLEVEPAPAANSRLDVIYTLPADVSVGDPVRAAAVATGLPGAVPVKPSIPEGAIELGTFRVAAGHADAGSAVLTETFKFAALAGGTLTVRTVAERDAVDTAWGSRVYCLADGVEYIRKESGGWQRAVPIAPSTPKIARGSITFTGLTAGTTKQMVVSLTSAQFTQPPNVQLTSGTGIAIDTKLEFWVSGPPTKDGFNASLVKGNASNHTVHWLAVGT